MAKSLKTLTDSSRLELPCGEADRQLLRKIILSELLAASYSLGLEVTERDFHLNHAVFQFLMDDTN
jgi:hypothetical protein